MAAARARRSDALAPRDRPGAPGPAVRPVTSSPRHVVTAAGSGVGIRWDRVSRMALLLVLVGITSLYIGPLHSYWATRHTAATKRADVHRLQQENRRLRARRSALRSKGTLENEARRLGMVRPGERPFVVRGLPKGP